MAMTITEKILAGHSEKDKVSPGEFILADIDLSLANDITAPIAIDELKKAGIKKLYNPKQIVLVPDHFAPNKDISSAQQCVKMRKFARQYGVGHYYEVGRMGIEHALLPEQGLIIPGSIVIGADSHTCTHGALGAFASGVGSTDIAFSWLTGKCWFKVPETIKIIFNGRLGKWVGGKDLILFLIGRIGVRGALYKAMEFAGEIIRSLSIDGRFTICNMAIEAGAKNGIIEPDNISMDYMRTVGRDGFNIGDLKSDEDASYAKVYEWDVSGLEPQVAFPHLPSNTVGISEAEKKNISIDQVVIGSCTNGRITDLRLAAGILKNKKVNSKVRLIIIPATQKIYLQAMEEGLLEIFIKSGAAVSTPTCGPCLGGHMGVLAEGERAVSTTNRNFVGRMGHPKSEVYLVNPAVAAASAIAGMIIGPDKA